MSSQGFGWVVKLLQSCNNVVKKMTLWSQSYSEPVKLLHGCDKAYKVVTKLNQGCDKVARTLQPYHNLVITFMGGGTV